jgi:hypothetical protein
MKELGIKISYNIKRIMKEKNIKQYELANLLKKTPENMSGFFSRLESGGASNLKSLNEIAKILNVDISIFFI